ncbi:hypothetical protein BDZ94DRAFT_714401 [Collybia nuda]|uniref:Uncharacterized protein n=1 Tax=Collybia nuda TaxID=64659 RepID=A0A9P5Y5J1_9AGAR|nr:hypothetical protein BDZ94DRAFT_714401 [Collybia nuda]
MIVITRDSAESTGLAGTHIGRARVIFKLHTHPDVLDQVISARTSWPSELLAYVEWYSRLSTSPDEATGMYSVKPLSSTQGNCKGIARTIHI